MNPDDFEEENMRLKSKFEQQIEGLTADDYEDDDEIKPLKKKKKHDKEKELNYMRKLAGMSTALQFTESYARMTQELIIVNAKVNPNDEIQQATGETGARIEATRKRLPRAPN